MPWSFDQGSRDIQKKTAEALIVFTFLSSKAKIMCSSICKCIGCKNFEESPERKTLMHLADAAEVRVQQQTAAKTKLSSQISDLLMRTTPVISSGSGRWEPLPENSGNAWRTLHGWEINKENGFGLYLSENVTPKPFFSAFKTPVDSQIHKQSTHFWPSDAVFLL